MIIKNIYNTYTYQVTNKVIRSYENLIIRALKSGLTKSDIKRIRQKKSFFYFPNHRTFILSKINIRLHLLKRLSIFIPDRKALYSAFEDILYRYEIQTSSQWNPAYIKKPYKSNFLESSNYQIQIYIIPSPYGFKWETPQSIFYSLRNYFSFKYKHKIGHAFVVLKKDNQTYAATGMTGETNYQVFYDLIFRKRGINFLYQMFRGRLEEASFVLEDIRYHQKINKIKCLNFNLDKKQFNSCLRHLEGWCEDGYYKRYGLTLRPEIDRGAGCVSFALSFLQVAGLLEDQQLSKWTRKIKIPKVLISNSNYKVGLFSLITKLSRKKKWVDNNDSFYPIEFLDPDLIYSSL